MKITTTNFLTINKMDLEVEKDIIGQAYFPFPSTSVWLRSSSLASH